MSSRGARQVSLNQGIAVDSSRALTVDELAYSVLAVVCIVSLFLAVALTKTPARYDEPWYTATVGLLHQYGLTSAFIYNLPGPAGPLYTFVQAAFEPLTHMKVPGIRLVNFFLMLGTMTVTAGILYLRGARRPILGALALIGLPTTWVAAGMALTEMPATFFFSCSLLLLLFVIRSERSTLVWIAALGGGFCLSLAIAGRQPYALVLLGVFVLALARPNKMVVLAVYSLAAAILPAWLFYIWGGLVPPYTAKTVQGLALAHAMLSFGYAAVPMALIAPSWFHLRRAWMLGSTVPVFVANAVFPMIRITPAFTLATRVLPPAGVAPYSWVLSSAIVAAAVLLIVASLVRVWENRSDIEFVCLAAMLFLLLAANATVVHTFSSRYISPCAPLMLLLANRHFEPSSFKAPRLVLGAVCGCASLATYLLWF